VDLTQSVLSSSAKTVHNDTSHLARPKMPSSSSSLVNAVETMEDTELVQTSPTPRFSAATDKSSMTVAPQAIPSDALSPEMELETKPEDGPLRALRWGSVDPAYEGSEQHQDTLFNPFSNPMHIASRNYTTKPEAHGTED
jgi:hypothetical protein